MQEAQWQRRQFLQFMGGATLTLSDGAWAKTTQTRQPIVRRGIPFRNPVQPDSLDDLTLPEEFTYQVVVQWGDLLTQDGQRFGYNNDFTAFVPLKRDEGLLWVNHEYISEEVYKASYAQVFGRELPKDRNEQVAIYKKELGGSVVHLKRMAETWQLVVDSAYNRRLDANSPLLADGPAAVLFSEPPVGTFANCSGGTTPWGTVLSCEENFQNYVPEVSFLLNDQGKLTGKVGTGGSFQLPGEHYGWVVEVDPKAPQSTPVKHTALGRFRHENVTLRVTQNQPLLAYQGDDRQGGHVWRYVSKAPYRKNQTARQKSRLLSEGTLYCARFDPKGKLDQNGLVMSGRGQWLPLTLETPLNPNTPSQTVDLPDNLVFEDGKFQRADGQPARVLGDLYASLGAILVDATRAAHAIGGTPTGRPEDLEVHPRTQQVYIAFTSSSSADTGLIDPSRPNDAAHLFDQLPPKLTQGKAQPYSSGQIWKLDEGKDVAGPEFVWGRFVPRPDQLGFSMPDNLVFDSVGNLWLATDMSTSEMNDDSPQGRFGNNAIYVLPTDPKVAGAGKVHRFACGPVECELTGPSFTPDETTLFVAVQHPGERMGIRTPDSPKDNRGNLRGSNWPQVGASGCAPRPAVVAITRR
ncbi:PhoX family phosphatase [Candidatus Cyanaurora vandensis]|uniref:PhoX family protein n=1 Tax=Candidatus Cyanaurora vandensis TaxID=2714958 RepID=UPI00257B7AA7|nr:alkaline phosphatase PhoX [Candidatus Cyanaurora vandensis]